MSVCHGVHTSAQPYKDYVRARVLCVGACVCVCVKRAMWQHARALYTCTRRRLRASRYLAPRRSGRPAHSGVRCVVFVCARVCGFSCIVQGDELSNWVCYFLFFLCVFMG